MSEEAKEEGKSRYDENETMRPISLTIVIIGRRSVSLSVFVMFNDF